MIMLSWCESENWTYTKFNRHQSKTKNPLRNSQIFTAWTHYDPNCMCVRCACELTVAHQTPVHIGPHQMHINWIRVCAAHADDSFSITVAFILSEIHPTTRYFESKQVRFAFIASNGSVKQLQQSVEFPLGRREIGYTNTNMKYAIHVYQTYSLSAERHSHLISAHAAIGSLKQNIWLSQAQLIAMRAT